MESIYLSGAVQTEPDIPDDAVPGHPTDGSSGGGITATIPGSQWYDAVAMELINAIKGGGVEPDRHDHSQLNASIDARIQNVKQALQNSVAAIQAKVQQIEIVPPGAIMYFSNTTPPNGNWLVCNGQAVSRQGYANLFNAIGTRFGIGNGSTTFNLPYLLDRTIWGGTSNVGEYRQPGLPNITGSFGCDDRQTWDGTVSGAFWADPNRHETGSKYSDYGQAIFFDASRSNPIYGRSGTVQPPALVMLPCIHI